MTRVLFVLRLCAFRAGNPAVGVRLYNILLTREGLVILLSRVRITSFGAGMAVSE